LDELLTCRLHIKECAEITDGVSGVIDAKINVARPAILRLHQERGRLSSGLLPAGSIARGKRREQSLS
jgi:hypothetical protein